MAFATGRPMAMSTMTAADTTRGTYSRHDSTLLLESNMRKKEEVTDEADTEDVAAVCTSMLSSSTGISMSLVGSLVVVCVHLRWMETDALGAVDGIHAWENLIEASNNDRHIQNDFLRVWMRIVMLSFSQFAIL